MAPRPPALAPELACSSLSKTESWLLKFLGLNGFLGDGCYERDDGPKLAGSEPDVTTSQGGEDGAKTLNESENICGCLWWCSWLISGSSTAEWSTGKEFSF